MKLKIKFNCDKLISLAIMSSFLVLIFQYLILIYFNLIDTVLGSQIQLVSKIAVGIFYLIAFPSVLKRKKAFFLFFYTISAFIFLLTVFIFPENTPYIQSNTFSYFFVSLPSFIYAFSLNDFNEFYEIMKKVGFGVFVIGTLIFLLVFLGESNIGRYSMSLSYYMLLPLLIYTDKIFKRINLFDLLIITITIIIIIALGSRGTFLSYFVFLFYRFVFIKDKLTVKRLLIYLTSFFTLFFYKRILKLTYNILLNFNIKSRTLILFMRDGIDLSGRIELYSIIIKQISDNPFLGLGLFGDRRFVGSYTHNIFIELWAHFGLIIGSMLIVLLLLIIYQVLIKVRNKNNLIVIWFSMGFIHLLVSSSYLIDFKFFIFLGLSLNIIFSKLNDLRFSH